jgi:hypothetical protein
MVFEKFPEFMGPFYERLLIFKSLVGLERPSFHFKKIATTEQMLFTQLLTSKELSLQNLFLSFKEYFAMALPQEFSLENDHSVIPEIIFNLQADYLID